jgi:hypothetical protein
VEFTVEDELLGFCDQTFIKMCPVFDVYEVVTSSNLERKVMIIGKIMD